MVKEITSKEFKELVFDYETETEWKFKGDKPTITEFWAPWCGPCRMVGPVLEELGAELEGKMNVFKVNVDEESQLSAAFGIRSIPSILFIPLEGDPVMSMGALPKVNLEKAIKEIFGI